MKNRNGFTLIELLTVGIILFMFLGIGIGWVKNIVKLVRCDFEAPYKAEIIHSLGVLPPVGAITGWINMGK